MRTALLCAALAWSAPALAAKGAGVGLPAMPGSYDAGAAGVPSDNPWWKDFGDPRLAAIVEQGLADNLDLASAGDRIRQAESVQLTALSALLPTLSFDAGINAQPANRRFISFTGEVSEGVDPNELFYQGNAIFNGALELDLTGRNVLGVQAASNDRKATEDDAADLGLTLASRIAGAWLDVALHAQRLALLERQIEATRQVLEVVELRFSRGEATAVDVLQQRQQVAATSAQLPLVRAALTVSRQQLAILVGRNPEDVPTGLPDTLPDLPAVPATGRPADLMEARPDLRAASSRLDAAWRRRMAAERAFLPSLRVTGNAGWSFTNNAGAAAFFGGGGTDPTLEALGSLYGEVAANRAVINAQLAQFGQETLPDVTFPDFGEPTQPETPGFQSWFNWGIGASLSVPIFNGRTLANLKSSRAQERAAANTLGSTQLVALAEVEGALAQDGQQRLRLDAVRSQADAARQAFEAASDRYADGIGDFLSLLSTQVTSQNADLQALQAHRDALSARIQLHEALGGSWTKSLAGGAR